MTTFNWGQSESGASSGGGYEVPHWWDQSGGGGGTQINLTPTPTPTPAPTPPPDPGRLNVDITSPQAFGGSVLQSVMNAPTFIDDLGKALFAKEGSIFGGIPGVGDIGRFLGDNPIGQAIGQNVRGTINLAGSFLESVPSGNADLTPRYQ